MNPFSIEAIAFEIAGHPVSWIELIGTLFGLVSVALAGRPHILTWPTGIINEIFLFLLFFQVQLYADMLLQVYFLVITLYGWYHWRRQGGVPSVSALTWRQRAMWLVGILIGTLGMGWWLSGVHLSLPTYFPAPAALPYIDAWVMMASIAATVLLARKKWESWWLWIAVDVVSIVLYFKKDIAFLAAEYVVFLGLAVFGLLNWRRQMQHG